MKFLIVGLGNIGEEYWGTRHNIGFRIVNALAAAHNAEFKENRYGATCEFRLKNQLLMLLKPSTYMNLSGNAVRYWLQRLNLSVENLIVVSDDLNLPFGTLRMRRSGSDGGHNGLYNIIWTLESDQFARIRVGIGNDFARGSQIDFVLGSLSEEEMTQVPELAEKIIGGIKTWALLGAEKAMNQLNTRKK